MSGGLLGIGQRDVEMYSRVRGTVGTGPGGQRDVEMYSRVRGTVGTGPGGQRNI